jgi:predicted Rossmann fold flavoprotein
MTDSGSIHGKRLIVAGGGAAGVFCAINAARLNPSLSVTVLEKTHRLLSKVKVSGGGRCNVTHACEDIGEMSACYPRGRNFVKKAFHRFFTRDTIEWFANRGVPLVTEADGRMFPATNTSETIINCLLMEANRYGVDFLYGSQVAHVQKDGPLFHVELSDGRALSAEYLCIACGGFSRSAQFDWIRELGHKIEEPVPSLFTMNIPGHPITRLMGVSVQDAGIRVSGTGLKERGPLLITHWGLSGPAVLRLSAWGARQLHEMDHHYSLQVNWCPDEDPESLRDRFQMQRQYSGSQTVGSKSPLEIPLRLWHYLLECAGADKNIRWSELSGRHQSSLIGQINAHVLPVSGKTTFKEEFVTAGGVSAAEIDPRTMESRLVPGLFFAGEIMDIDGITGGYNFQHAWTSGWIAAEEIAAYAKD